MTSIAPITHARATRRRTNAQAAAAAAPAAAGARSQQTAFVGAPRKGGKATVEQRFSSLEQRFIPEKAKGVDTKLQFKFSGSGGGDWYVVIKDGKIKVTKGTGPDPDATVIAKASDYEKIANGEMNKTLAFLRGKLKIEGDRKYLDAWETWFKPI